MLGTDLRKEVNRLHVENEEGEARAHALRAELDGLVQDEHEHEYQLSAVFMHRGKNGILLSPRKAFRFMLNKLTLLNHCRSSWLWVRRFVA